MNMRLTEVIKNLLIINALFYLATLAYPDFMYRYMALYPVESELFMPHQFVSHMFMHSISPMHIFFNMFMLWMFGTPLEARWGSKRFLTYYVITGLGAAALHLLTYEIELSAASGDSQLYRTLLNNPTVGASGAVYGVLLGFAMMFPQARLMLIIPPIPIKARTLIFIMIGIELLQGIRMNDNIAHFAHLGGMLFGFILIRYWRRNTIL